MLTVGLTYTGNEVKHNNYVRWLQAGSKLNVIKLQAPGNQGELRQCDALVLSGGIDMHPDYYHGQNKYPHMPKTGFDRQRDEYEIKLLDEAFKKQMPVMGICRGMQLINVFLGGTLVQHVPIVAGAHMGGPDKEHAVQIRDDSELFRITGVRSARANSAHHQCIDQIAVELKENCRSADGIIEGVEWSDATGRSFMLAVQWHPERMKKFDLQDSPLSKNIRDRFIEEIYQYKQKK